MGVENLIKNLGLEFGLDLSLNEKHLASLIVDNRFEVEFEYVEQMKRLFVSCPLTRLEGEGNEAIFRAFLEANLYGRETAGAVFSIDHRTNEVILFFKIDAEQTDYEDFKDQMERYINVLADWSVKIETLVQIPLSKGRKNDGNAPSFQNMIRV